MYFWGKFSFIESSIILDSSNASWDGSVVIYSLNELSSDFYSCLTLWRTSEIFKVPKPGLGEVIGLIYFIYLLKGFGSNLLVGVIDLPKTFLV